MSKNNIEKPKKDIDKISGVETTNHEWDGIRELNNPTPRWWLMVWAVSIIWSIWYWVVYPAWPTMDGNTKGTYGWTQHNQLEKAQLEIKALKKQHLGKFMASSFEEIMEDNVLREFAIAGGSAAFKDNCAACHGTGAEGSFGYPNLNDDDWIWGGKIEDIYTSLKYGIRANHDDTRMGDMPAFLTDNILSKAEILEVTDYVLSLSGKANTTDIGKVIYQEQCSSCHGDNGKGMQEVGAPNLTDAIWLFSHYDGGDSESDLAMLKSDMYETIAKARNVKMPYWEDKLREETIRQLSVYVHALGGGEYNSFEEDLIEDKIIPSLSNDDNSTNSNSIDDYK